METPENSTSLKKTKRKKWDRETILNACDQIFHQNGILLYKDLKQKGMPAPSTIEHIFKIPFKEFRDSYYPITSDVSANSPYKNKTKQEWTNLFIAEYKKIHPHSRSEYDQKKTPGTPSWRVIAKMNNTNSWNELLKITKLYIKKPNTTFTNYTVTSTSYSQQQLEKLSQKHCNSV